jgi:hypothetical protein
VQEAIGCLTVALADGELTNPVLGETHRLHLIQTEAFLRRELEENR